MKVRLIRRVTRRGGREYVSYSITLPKSLVEGLSLAQASELELEVREIAGRLAIVLYKS